MNYEIINNVTFEQRAPMHPNAKARLALLQTLYRAREAEPRTGWLTERDLKDAHGDIEFAMGVLVESGQAVAEGFRYRITGAGVLAFEAEGRSPA